MKWTQGSSVVRYLSVVLSVGYVGCSSVDGGGPYTSSPSEGALASAKSHGHDCLRIAWLGNDPSNAYDNAILDGARSVAAANRATVTPFYGAFDPALQLAQCNEAVDSGDFDAILILPTDGVGIIDCVENARRHHIPVVALDLPIGSDPATAEPQVRGQTGAVLTPAAKFGTSLASLVVDACAPLATCNVVYLAGSFDVAFDQIALAELDAASAAHPNVQLVAIEEAFYDEAYATELTAGILAANPDVHLIIGAGDQMARGAETAVAAAGPLPNEVAIVGGGAGAYGIDAVRDGRWLATFVTLPRDEGTLGASMAVQAVRHRRISDRGIDPVEQRGYPAFFAADNQDEFGSFIPQWPG